MDHKIMTILVGTLCFGGGVAVGVGGMALKTTMQPQEIASNVQRENREGIKNQESENILQEEQDAPSEDIKEDVQQDIQQGIEKDIQEKPQEDTTQDTAQEKPETKPTTIPEGMEEWKENVDYQTGAQVIYQGSVYSCIQQHTSLIGWEPAKVPALWSENK